MSEIDRQAADLDDALCKECREKLKDWGVNVHNVFLSDVSNAFVVRHLGSYENGSSPQFVPISPEDLAEGR